MPYNSNYVSAPSNTSLNIEGLRWNHAEKPQSFRKPFSKDRDRILYSKSFLRLRGKTQVFMLNHNDYIRTRLTHTLEVNQIAKTIGLDLGLNLELIEAIALGHDVGHTPFGHIGERTLDELLRNEADINSNDMGFKHNLQALRLLCELEKGADFPTCRGLNLTKYTLWGIAHHSSVPYKVDEDGNIIEPREYYHPFYNNFLDKIKSYWSFEGYIVALADEIAQRHHDIEDGLRYGIINRQELIDEIKKFNKLFNNQEKKCCSRLQNEIVQLEDSVFNALFARLVVNLYVRNVIQNTKLKIKIFEEAKGINTKDDFIGKKDSFKKNEYENIVSMSEQLLEYDKEFHSFLKTRILSSYQAQAMDGKAAYIVKKLYNAFKENPKLLPDTSLFSYAYYKGFDKKISRADILKNINNNDGILRRCIADYIGGMTDQFAYDEFDRLYGTKYR